MKNFVFLGVFILFLLSSCFQTQKPCTYEKVYFKAKVAKIDTLEQLATDTTFDVLLSFNNSYLYKQLQSLSKIKEIKIDNAFLKRNKISKGKVFTGIVSQTDEKHCPSFYVSFDQKLK